MSTEIKIYKDINYELKNIWLDLEKRSFNHCFQSFSWIIYLINFYKKNNLDFSLQIVTIKKNGKFVVILPFWIINKFSIKILKWIGNDFSDYNGPIISKDFFYKKTDFFEDLEYIKKKLETFDVILFERQPSNIFESQNPFFFYLKNSNVLKTYFVKTVNISHHRKIKSNNFFFFNSHSIIDYKKYIKIILDLKVLQVYKKELFKKKYINFLKNFYNELGSIQSDYLKICLSVLKFEKEELSYCFGILYKNYFYYLIPAYRNIFRKLSPGKLLLQKIIDWCFENKIDVLDFGQGEEEYKRKVTNSYNYIGHYNYSNSFKGYIYLLIIAPQWIKLLKNFFFK